MTLDIKLLNPNEVIKYFQLNFKDLVEDLKNCTHHYDSDNLNPWHLEGDCWTHTLMVLKQVQAREESLYPSEYNALVLAAICHDLGKPAARSIDDEAKKVRFKGHEGISFFKSIKVLDKMLKDGMIDAQIKEMVLKIVSLHSSIFDAITDGKLNTESLKIKYTQNHKLFYLVTKMSEADSRGRFCIDPDNFRANFYADDYSIRALTTYFKDQDYQHGQFKTPDDCQAKLTILIGPPCSGKDYYLSNKMEPEDEFVIISRDTVVMEFGQRMGLGSEYSEIWRRLTDEYQREIDQIVLRQFDDSVKERKNIVINMTNMSRKSRLKWLKNPLILKNDCNYFKEAIVFCTDYDTLFQRNSSRYELTGKFIPDYVMHNMMSGFAFPMYDEFDSIKIKF